jgi:hypothetical protein
MLGQYQALSTYHLPFAPILTVPIPHVRGGGMKNVSFPFFYRNHNEPGADLSVFGEKLPKDNCEIVEVRIHPHIFAAEAAERDDKSTLYRLNQPSVLKVGFYVYKCG